MPASRTEVRGSAPPRPAPALTPSAPSPYIPPAVAVARAPAPYAPSREKSVRSVPQAPPPMQAKLTVSGPDGTNMDVRLDDQTPLGRWMTAVDRQVRSRWAYPEQARVLGVRGVALVRFLVARNGSVDDVVVYRSSGSRDLDAAALAAVPSRTERVPEGTEAPVQLRFTFRYE